MATDYSTTTTDTTWDITWTAPDVVYAPTEWRKNIQSNQGEWEVPPLTKMMNSNTKEKMAMTIYTAAVYELNDEGKEIAGVVMDTVSIVAKSREQARDIAVGYFVGLKDRQIDMLDQAGGWGLLVQ